MIVKGNPVDDNTRCSHYHGPLDIIAIRFKCCDQYYPCYFCHQEEVDHPAIPWRRTEFNTNAILCGACTSEMTIAEYKASNYRCPCCNAPFNPKCINHDHLYFEQD